MSRNENFRAGFTVPKMAKQVGPTPNAYRQYHDDIHPARNYDPDNLPDILHGRGVGDVVLMVNEPWRKNLPRNA